MWNELTRNEQCLSCRCGRWFVSTLVKQWLFNVCAVIICPTKQPARHQRLRAAIRSTHHIRKLHVLDLLQHRSLTVFHRFQCHSMALEPWNHLPTSCPLDNSLPSDAVYYVDWHSTIMKVKQTETLMKLVQLHSISGQCISTYEIRKKLHIYDTETDFLIYS